jgi:hypothetical protein
MGHSVEGHFEGRSPHVREIYDLILATGREFGPVEEDPKKTSIHLNRKSAFAGISTTRQALTLTVKAAREIVDDRIKLSQRASAGRWYNSIRLTSPDEFDAKIIDWLKESYEISG